MSTKMPILPVVLTAFGLLGMASAEPAEPPPKEQPSEAAQAPPGEQQGVILLVDGQVVQGVIVQDDEGCLLKSTFGSMRFPRRRIEATFRTLHEAYEYKLSQFPDEDTSERLKLAQWCLAQNLQEEAKAQLLGILKINPKHPPATAMLQKMEQAEARQARRRDPGVKQAGATSDELPPTGPKELDPAALRRRGAGMMAGGIADIPNIFDLPRPTALKISEDFNRSIHPILQTSCAKCHNDRYPGAFQLRQVRKPRDLNRDTLDMNLEATLHLIDPLNPAKSELLSSSLRPHGYGKSQHPIFRGSADPSYQKLSQWVNSVSKPFKRDALRQAAAQGGSASEEEQFAADRAVNLGSPAAPNHELAPARQYPLLPVPPRNAADPNEFPLATMENATALRTTGVLQTPPSSPKTAAAASELPKLPPGTAPSPAASSTKKPKKPVKIDPAVLERVLKARNGGN